MVYIFRPGHITKMAAKLVYGKNVEKSSFPEPPGRLPSNLMCSILGVRPSKFI